MMAQTTRRPQPRRLRYSSRFPHLSYELARGVKGEWVLTFREHTTFRVYVLEAGRAYRIDESDVYGWDPVKDRYVSQTALEVAKALVGRIAEGKVAA